MIGSFKKFKSYHMPKNSFLANVITLITGTALAQAIPIAISPILTRLYTPEDFGIFALYTSISSIISVIATGRYELAIMLPEKDEDAVNILALSIFITFIVSFAIFFFMFVFNANITKLLGDKNISKWLYFVPFTVFLTGIYNTVNYWLNRKKRYKKLACNRVLQSTTIASANFGMGIYNYNSSGLVVSSILGQSVAAGILSWQFLGEDKKRLHSIYKEKIKQQAKIYKNFPLYTIFTELLNVTTNQVPVILLNNFFGANIIGIYNLTQRVLGNPVAIVSKSVYDVFKERASSHYYEFRNCKDLFVKTFKKLVLISLFPFILFFSIAPFLFSLIFGEEWRTAGEYARVLSIMYFFRFISSPLSYMYYIAGRQKEDLLIHLYLGFSTIIYLFSSYFIFKKVIYVLAIFSINYSVVYSFYLFRSYSFSKGVK